MRFEKRFFFMRQKEIAFATEAPIGVAAAIAVLL